MSEGSLSHRHLASLLSILATERFTGSTQETKYFTTRNGQYATRSTQHAMRNAQYRTATTEPDELAVTLRAGSHVIQTLAWDHRDPSCDLKTFAGDATCSAPSATAAVFFVEIHFFP